LRGPKLINQSNGQLIINPGTNSRILPLSEIEQRNNNKETERYRGECLSKANPETTALIEKSFQIGDQIINQGTNLTMQGLKPILAGINKSMNSNHPFKQLSANFLGIGLLLSAIVGGIKTLTDILFGRNEEGKFKLGNLALNSMIGWLGYDAIEYAKGKNNSFGSSQSILKRLVPIFLIKGFNSMISKPQSASYKVGSLFGLNDPLKSLTSELVDNVNPAKLFGWGLGKKD
jgi:hypothetical protein